MSRMGRLAQRVRAECVGEGEPSQGSSLPPVLVGMEFVSLVVSGGGEGRRRGRREGVARQSHREGRVTGRFKDFKKFRKVWKVSCYHVLVCTCVRACITYVCDVCLYNIRICVIYIVLS